jgi:protein ImuA
MKPCKGLISGAAAWAGAPAHGVLPLGLSSIDPLLHGGLGLGQVHELVPARPCDMGAAAGFGLGLCMLGGRAVIWVQQDYAALETGIVHGVGVALFGLDPARLILVRTGSAKDTLFAMEEALKTRGFGAVVGEMAEEGKAADLTATRRLSLAAQKGGGLALLFRHRAFPSPSAAATRWRIATVRGATDGFGGLGRTSFAVSLTKNRRGSCGDWIVQWDHHERRFTEALSVGVAAEVFHRPHRAALAGA